MREMRSMIEIGLTQIPEMFANKKYFLSGIKFFSNMPIGVLSKARDGPERETLRGGIYVCFISDFL